METKEPIHSSPHFNRRRLFTRAAPIGVVGTILGILVPSAHAEIYQVKHKDMSSNGNNITDQDTPSQEDATVASIPYVFGLVAPGQKVGVYLHGFSPNDVTVLDIHATAGDASLSQLHPSVNVGATNVGEHVDGTLFHQIFVTNVSTSSGGLAAQPTVSVTALSQALS